MTLELVDHRAPAAEKRSWTPFPSSEGYERPHWWENAGGAVGDPWFVEVLEGGVQVARVQLDERGGINPEYTGAPAVDSDVLLEIQYIEVSTGARRRRVATRALRALAERHPERRLMAYSEDAEDFWDSLDDWERFDHPDGRSRPLFVQRLTLNP
ncbi:GNAT family N-acetyltransferase [Mycolicibacterium fortuitum]|uniref:GNAT family N-acetyltransferase n=1 Tax=Mycolicibacterium fortuitum TaxID=1766 RepID=UPI00262958A8|nr:GNAT family N-acetyltransferase [Mycolicibacterium fortuitum]